MTPGRRTALLIAVLGGTPVIFPAIVILPPSDPAPLARAHAALNRRKKVKQEDYHLH